jgi:hypothetical protein
VVEIAPPAADLARNVDHDLGALGESGQRRPVSEVAVDYLRRQPAPEHARRIASGQDAHGKSGSRQRPHHVLSEESRGSCDGGQAPRGVHARAGSSS